MHIVSDGTLLSVLLDLNTDSWILRERASKDPTIVFEEFFEAFLSFITTFLMQNHHNQLVVTIYGVEQPYASPLIINCRKVIFPVFKGDIAQNIVAHSQQISVVNRHLHDTILNQMKQVSTKHCSLDACFSRTLCYILRVFILQSLTQTPEQVREQGYQEAVSFFQHHRESHRELYELHELGLLLQEELSDRHLPTACESLLLPRASVFAHRRHVRARHLEQVPLRPAHLLLFGRGGRAEGNAVAA